MLRPGARGRGGRARYLFELNDRLARSLRTRWARWRPRFTPVRRHRPAGARHARRSCSPRGRMRAPYSLSALQRFAACPYQFYLSAICRLAPRDGDRPARAARSADARQPLPRGAGGVPARAGGGRGGCRVDRRAAPTPRERRSTHARPRGRAYQEELAPAIRRVWQDEVESLRVDLRTWLEKSARDQAQWEPIAFELAFGLPAGRATIRRSVERGVVLGGQWRLRGIIDLMERRSGARTALRVTDYKTGREPHEVGHDRRQGRDAPARALRARGGADIRRAGVGVAPVLLHARRRVLRARGADGRGDARAAASRCSS